MLRRGSTVIGFFVAEKAIVAPTPDVHDAAPLTPPAEPTPSWCPAGSLLVVVAREEPALFVFVRVIHPADLLGILLFRNGSVAATAVLGRFPLIPRRGEVFSTVVSPFLPVAAKTLILPVLLGEKTSGLIFNLPWSFLASCSVCSWRMMAKRSLPLVDYHIVMVLLLLLLLLLPPGFLLGMRR